MIPNYMAVKLAYIFIHIRLIGCIWKVLLKVFTENNKTVIIFR